MHPHTNRLLAPIDVNNGGVRSAYENTLDLGSTDFSGNLALQSYIQQTLRTEMQSKATRGMKSL